MIQKELRSIQQFRAQGGYGALAAKVLDWLEIMEGIVNRPKQPEITVEDWNPLAAMIDLANFDRIGNYGEQIQWADYVKLLVMWANSSWWQGRIWRMWEVPGFAFCETEERSSHVGPVREGGPYNALNSFCVYEFDDQGRVRHIYIYDQRPLDGPPAGHVVGG